MSRKITIAKYLGQICALASIANLFVKNDLLQQFIWFFLCITLLLVIWDDARVQKRMFELNSKYIEGILNLERYPDELCKHLRESNEFSQKQLEKIEAMIWDKFVEIEFQTDKEKEDE